MIRPNHPYHFIAPLAAKHIAVFHFSKYVYRPDSLFDERTPLSIASSDLSVTSLNRVISSLRSDEELALHSDVTIQGRTFHIPMIDFAFQYTDWNALMDRMLHFIPKPIIQNMSIYFSGRSYHAYSSALIKPKQWRELMGRLLLINPKGEPEIVDSRWVGHRLIGGYCSLRWSNNSEQYLCEPERVDFLGSAQSNNELTQRLRTGYSA